MDKVTFGDKTYVKASVIARDLGYTTDYVGQLCRGEKVDAQLIGRSWYVETDSIQNHKSNRYRSVKAATTKSVRKQIEVDSEEDRAHFYTHDRAKPTVAIQYDTDEAELFPAPTKQSAGSHTKLEVGLADAREVSVEAKSNKYHFEAPEREEIQFHGTLRVTDFNSEVLIKQDSSDQSPQKVAISSSGKPTKIPKKHLLKNTSGAITMRRPDLQKPHVANSLKTGLKTGSVAVSVEQEALDIRTSVAYQLSVGAVVLSSLLVAVAIVGFETQVIANDTLMVVDYVFVIKNVLASLYLSI